MAEEWDYGNDWGATYDPWYPEMTNGGGVTDYFQSPAYQSFTGWGDPTGVGSSGDTSGGNWWDTVLGGLGSVGSFLGKNAGTLGPLLSGAGSIAGGAIGSGAAQDASRLQADALNRGIDLQTAQWLQQQQNLSPYLQAGQGGLSQLQQLAGREQPALPGATAAVGKPDYFPGSTPGWTPQNYQAQVPVPDPNGYMWRPGQGPQAQDFRYTPGNIPQASQYRYTPGAVPTLSGQELLANDPGVAFRQSEARKALEGSAAARGDLLSGGTLQALQSRSQDLASQEYGNAWNRASQQAQLREGWAQTASQMGWGQAESEARLREQVNQIASQQGWSQAQAEAAFREGMAQQASQQGYTQALAGQQANFGQGLDTSKWNTLQQQQWAQEQYKNMLEQSKLRYGMDVTENTTNYDRAQQLYRQQLGQHVLPWEQASTLSNLGGQAVGMYGQGGQNAANSIGNLLAQLGTAQGTGAAGQGLAWNRAVGGAVNQFPSILAGLNA